VRISELSYSETLANFSHKNPLYEFALNFLLSPNDKILPKNKNAGCEYFQNKFINCGGTSK
jgi:hypothetical protein